MEGAKVECKKPHKPGLPQARLPDVGIAAIVSLALVTSVFFDVIFLGTSISHTSNFIGAEAKTTRVISLTPQPKHRRWLDAFADNGGALWQSEPMIAFMRYCINNNESPYWNPYSGCGQLGPESLVDLKFSFHTILNALGGGSQIAFNAILIGSYYLSIFFLCLLSLRLLRLSVFAAIATCIVYLLNGYNTAALATNTSFAYLYFPIHLYVLLSFAQSPSIFGFACLSLANTLVLSVTFLPTTFLTLVSNHLLAAGFIWWQSIQNRTRVLPAVARNSIYWVLAGILALGSLSFLYFPILESFEVVSPLTMYNARIFHPANLNGLLSLFTPKHFWEEYMAIPAHLWSGAPHNPAFHVSNAMYHFGLVPFLLASTVLTNLKNARAPFSIICLAMIVFSLARVFNVFLISDFIGVIPGFKSLGEQYWFVMPAIALPLAAGLGFDSLRNNNNRGWIPVVAVYIVVAAAFLNNYLGYGIVSEFRHHIVNCLLLFGIIVASSIFLMITKFSVLKEKCMGHKEPMPGLAGRFSLWDLALLALLFFELTSYNMGLRFKANNLFIKAPSAIEFLKRHLGNHRVANFNRGCLPPEHGSAFQIQQIESLNMNILPSYERLFADAFLIDAETRWGIFPTLFKHNDSNHFNVDALSFLGVKYVVISSFWPRHAQILLDHGYKKAYNDLYWTIYENLNPFPRMFAVAALSRDSDKNIDFVKTRTIAYSNDPQLHKSAKELGIAITTETTQKIPNHSVDILEYHNTCIKAKAILKQPALLVMTDNYHPNWIATVDGKTAHTGLVDRSFRGIAVPAGEHIIEMRYEPRSLGVALITSSLSLAITFLIFLTGCLRRKNSAFELR